MPVKSVFSPHHGHDLYFGRRPLDPHRSRVRLAAVAPRLPEPPASWDSSRFAPGSMRAMFRNDQLGCCVISRHMRNLGIVTGFAGSEFVATDAQVAADYSRVAGFDPRNPRATDNGTDPDTADRFYASTGYPDASKDAGYLSVDATNVKLLKQAVSSFLCVGLDIDLPDAWITPFPSAPGFTWGVAGPPDPNNGHEFLAFGFDAAGLLVVPWGGLPGHMPWAAVARYATAPAGGDVLLNFNEEMAARAQVPGLVALFDQMGGKVPQPPAPPSPPPSGPPVLMTLDLRYGYFSLPSSGVVAVVRDAAAVGASVGKLDADGHATLTVDSSWRAAPPNPSLDPNPKGPPPMPSIQDTFIQVAGKDAKIVADKDAVAAATKTLDDDTTDDLDSHASFNRDVVAAGPTLVRLPDGTPVALLPQGDGTVTSVVLHDGTQPPPAPPAA